MLSIKNTQRNVGASKVVSTEQSNNPLHGLTLAKVVTRLVEHYGWDGMAQRININCFKSDPSVKSALKFLRKTQWARDKVEGLYISTFVKQALETEGAEVCPAADESHIAGRSTGTETYPEITDTSKPVVNDVRNETE